SLVGVVGRDFPEAARRMLADRQVDLSGLEAVEGKTFRWVGRFGRDLNSAKTLATHLNVFETFRPKLTQRQKECPAVFLANIDPQLQWEVLAQMRSPGLVACDTMNFWISGKRAALKELLSKVDIFFVNDEEARKLARASSTVAAARTLGRWGPSVVVVKKGEHGAMLFAGGRIFPYPAFPMETVKDPTGAGDSFAGAFLGSLLSGREGERDLRACLHDLPRLKRAVVCGSVMASFTVSDFSTRALEDLSLPAVNARMREYSDLLSLDAPVPA
ncbi:MAG: PfkB family carbohydrate kinase, partial [Elusimicrobiota bacterium]